jgi:hypothetical protein
MLALLVPRDYVVVMQGTDWIRHVLNVILLQLVSCSACSRIASANQAAHEAYQCFVQPLLAGLDATTRDVGVGCNRSAWDRRIRD